VLNTSAGNVRNGLHVQNGGATVGTAIQIDLNPTDQAINTHSVLLKAVNDGSNNSRFELHTSQAAGAPAMRLRVDLGMQLGSPTGGDKGLGALNAVAVYDDNVLLTCQALQPEFLRSGSVELDKWDAIMPDGREHTTARLFDQMLQEGFDPRDPLNYVAKLREDAGLPGMPTMDTWKHNTLSLGEINSRLWLAVDCLSVAFASLVDKVQALEGRLEPA
jgi:hypothetical protein